MMRKLEVPIIPPLRKANDEKAGGAHDPASKKSE
jgi:hypothetical protein